MSTLDVLSTLAHSAGSADIACAADGTLFTCGGEGQLNCFHPDGTKTEHSEHHGAATCVAVSPSGEYVVTGAEDHSVFLYKAANLEDTRLLGRATLPVRHVSFSPDGTHVVFSSDELRAKVVRLEDGNLTPLVGCEGSVLCAEYDPRGEFIATTATDSQARVFRVGSGAEEPAVVGHWGIARASGKHRVRLAWSPDGAQIACPNGGDVTLVARGSWKPIGTLSGGHAAQSLVTHVSYSADGRRLASLATDNALVVWSVSSRQPLRKYQHDALLTGACWTPAGALALIDNMGMMGTLTDLPVLPSLDDTSAAATTTTTNTTVTTGEDPLLANEHTTFSLLSNGSTGVQPAKKTRRLRKAVDAFIDSAAVDDDLDGDGEGDGDQGEEAEEGELGDDKMLEDFVENDDSNLGVSSSRGHRSSSLAPAVLMPELLQPGSTPERDKRRFLAWTVVGTITTREEKLQRTIEIEFADASRRRVQMLDFHQMSLGALGEGGAAFGGANVIKFRPFTNWAHNEEWMVTLPESEGVLLVAAGETFGAFATTAGLIRLYSTAGVALGVAPVPAHLVSMTAFGSQLAVVTAPSPYALQLHLWNVQTGQTVFAGSMPLTPKSTLTWLGFSDEGSVCAADSTGMLWMHAPQQMGGWVPVLQTAETVKGRSKHYIIGVQGKEMLSVVVKFPDLHPPVLPRPLPCVTPLRVPIIAVEEAQAEAEGKVLLMRLVRDPTTETDKAILQLVDMACRAGQNGRALDLVHLLENETSYIVASRLAAGRNLPSLADHIQTVLEEKFRHGEDETEESMDTEPERFTAPPTRRVPTFTAATAGSSSSHSRSQDHTTGRSQTMEDSQETQSAEDDDTHTAHPEEDDESERTPVPKPAAAKLASGKNPFAVGSSALKREKSGSVFEDLDRMKAKSKAVPTLGGGKRSNVPTLGSSKRLKP